MKKALFPLLYFLAITAYSDVLPINKFSGINTDDSPIVLVEGQTPDSENVVTDIGVGLQPRDGFVLFSTQTSSGLWSFGKSDGTRYMITASSGNLKAATSTTFSVQIATIATSVPTYGTSLGDKFYFINTVDGLKSWDGSSVSVASVTMKADKITTYKGRLAIGNRTGNARVVYLSKYLDGTSFTAPSLNPSDDDAAQITTSGAIDEAVEGLVVFQDKLMVYKPSSFSGIYGTRRSNFTLRTFSDSIGLSGAESLQDCDGKLRWLARGRKVYEFDGTSFYKISDNVNNLFSTIAQGDTASRSVTYTTESDFESGTLSNLDSITSPGDLRLSIGSDGLKDSCYDADVMFDTATCSFGSRYIYRSFTAGSSYSLSSLTLRLAQGTTNSIDFNVSVLSDNSSSPGTVLVSTTIPSTSVLSSVSDVTASFPTITSLTSGTRYWIKVGRSCTSDFTAFYWYYGLPECDASEYHRFNNAANEANGRLKYKTNERNYVSIGTFTSTVNSAPFLSGWGSFNANQDNNSGTHSFYIRSSSNVFTQNSSTPTWTAVSVGAIPSVSAYQYFQLRDVIAQTDLTQTPVLYDMTQNWTEGSTIKMASNYFNQRYWLSVSISSTANNKILIYDKKNQWQKYSGINADAMTIHNSKLYFGNSSGIYEAETGNTDNGSPITSYYNTATLAASGLNNWSSYNKLYLTTEFSDASIAAIYQLNGMDTEFSLGSSLMNYSEGFQDIKFPFPMDEAQQSKLISFKFTISSSSFWRILNANIYYKPGQEPD